MAEWVLINYMDGDKLTRVGQERYAEFYGNLNRCIHCYHVEDGEECCNCESTGWTENPEYWFFSERK